MNWNYFIGSQLGSIIGLGIIASFDLNIATMMIVPLLSTNCVVSNILDNDVNVSNDEVKR